MATGPTLDNNVRPETTISTEKKGNDVFSLNKPGAKASGTGKSVEGEYLAEITPEQRETLAAAGLSGIKDPSLIQAALKSAKAKTAKA